jgi:hypothetical protein
MLGVLQIVCGLLVVDAGAFLGRQLVDQLDIERLRRVVRVGDLLDRSLAAQFLVVVIRIAIDRAVE